MKRLLVVALVVLSGCGAGGRLRTPPSPSPAPGRSSAAAMPAFLRVTGRPSGSLVAVAWRNGVTTITSRLGGTRVGIAGRSGGFTRHGRLIAVARTSHDGVRLKSAHGRTLWRVRTVRGRVQIRRGERDVRYEFRRDADENIVVRHGTATVGSVRAIENGAELVDARGVRLGVSSSPPDEDMAVLLCREIPPDLRAVLTAVLLRSR